MVDSRLRKGSEKSVQTRLTTVQGSIVSRKSVQPAPEPNPGRSVKKDQPASSKRRKTKRNKSISAITQPRYVMPQCPMLGRVDHNFVEFGPVLGALAMHAYHQLETVVNVLPRVQGSMNRQRIVLDVLVQVRQEFVKAYVLTKWMRTADHVRVMIDLSTWACSVMGVYGELERALRRMRLDMRGLEARPCDLATALQVLAQGQPAQLARGFGRLPRVKASTIMQTLHDLNVGLSIRLALVENLAPEFANYEIQNGRATFRVPNLYEVQVSIADDSADACFHMIDFKFVFACVLPRLAKDRIVQVGNKVLQDGLEKLLTTLQTFALHYRLGMINDEFTSLSQGLYYGLIQGMVFPTNGSVVISFWQSSTLDIRLTRGGGIGILHGGSTIAYELEKSAKWNFQRVIERHVRWTIQKVGEVMAKYWGSSHFATVLQDKLEIKLANGKSTTFTIEPDTGQCALIITSRLVEAIDLEIKDETSPQKMADSLIKLQHFATLDHVASRAKFTGWTVQANVIVSRHALDAKYVLVLRHKNIAFPWGVVVSMKEGQPSTDWWLAQVSRKWGLWRLTSAQKLDMGPRPRKSFEQYSYRMFWNLSQFVADRVVLKRVCTELEQRCVRHKVAWRSSDGPLIAMELSDAEKTAFDRSIFMEFSTSLHSIKVRVQGRIKQKTLVPLLAEVLGTLNNADAGTGIFTLEVGVAENVVQEVWKTLGDIQKLVDYLEVLNESRLSITKKSRGCLEFEYKGMAARLEVGESIELVLNQDNPQRFIVGGLQGVLQTHGLGAVLSVLHQFLPLHVAFDQEFRLHSWHSQFVVIPQSVTETQIYFAASRVVLHVRVMFKHGQLQVYISHTVGEANPLMPLLSLDSGSVTSATETGEALLNVIWRQGVPGCATVPLWSGVACAIEDAGLVLRCIRDTVVKCGAQKMI